MSDNKFGAGILMYQYEQEDVQVFLVESEAKGTFTIPTSIVDNQEAAMEFLTTNSDNGTVDHEQFLLDPVNCEERKVSLLANAFEIDWRKLPENSKRRQFLEANKGAFYSLKEAVKLVAPAEYQMLKELKEVLNIRNIMKNL